MNENNEELIVPQPCGDGGRIQEPGNLDGVGCANPRRVFEEVLEPSEDNESTESKKMEPRPGIDGIEAVEPNDYETYGDEETCYEEVVEAEPECEDELKRRWDIPYDPEQYKFPKTRAKDHAHYIMDKNDTISLDYPGHVVILHRIVCIKDFYVKGKLIKAGTKGGFIQDYYNLSGKAWVFDESRVYGDSMVQDQAIIMDNSVVIDSVVRDNAVVEHGSMVKDHSKVSDDAIVTDESCISSRSVVRGTAYIKEGCVIEESIVEGNVVKCVVEDAHIGPDGCVMTAEEYFSINKIGSRLDRLTAYRTKRGGVRVSVGCFTGSLDEFAVAVNKKEDSDKSKMEYLILIGLIKYRFSIDY